MARLSTGQVVALVVGALFVFGTIFVLAAWFLLSRLTAEPEKKEPTQVELWQQEAAARKAEQERQYAEAVERREQEELERTEEHLALAEAPEANRPETVVYAEVDTVARDAPRENAEAVLRVDRGDRFRIDRRSGEWISVLTEFEQEMWVPAAEMREATEAAPIGAPRAEDGPGVAESVAAGARPRLRRADASIEVEFLGLRRGLRAIVTSPDGLGRQPDQRLRRLCREAQLAKQSKAAGWPFESHVTDGHDSWPCPD